MGLCVRARVVVCFVGECILRGLFSHHRRAPPIGPVAAAENVLVGSYCVFTNQGGLVHPHTSVEEIDELSSLVQVLWACGFLICLWERVPPDYPYPPAAEAIKTDRLPPSCLCVGPVDDRHCQPR